MENPGENQSLNDAPSEFIALGELIDPELGPSDAPPLHDDSRGDLKTLRKLGYRYCNRCEQIVQPQIMSLRKRPGSFFFPYGFEHPLLGLLMLLGKSSPAQPKKIWGCPHCGRDYRRLKRVKKRHLLPPKERPKGIPRRYLILMISVPVVAFCVCMYALLPKSDQDRPSSGPPSDSLKVIPGDTEPLTRRVVETLKKRPGLATTTIAVESHGDSVTITGRVPSCYEAMLIHRAVEQKPGVREVVDLLEFEPPDESYPNPLIEKGRPEDLEPYLTFHIRRHVGAMAHIDPVHVEADMVQIRGTLLNVEDKVRVETILRSIPILRGFHLRQMLTPLLAQTPGESSDKAAHRAPSAPDASATQRPRDTTAMRDAGRVPSMGLFKDTASGWTFAYVINCSGSMSTRNALDVAKRELLASLDQLRPGALFSVIFYNLKIWVFTDPSGQYEMMPASVENKTFVRSQLKTVVPNGKSADLLALQIALDLKPDVVFFLTPADLMTKNQVDAILPQAGRTRIHVIELGPGPDPGTVSQPSRLATVTRGTYRYFDVTKFPMSASGN